MHKIPTLFVRDESDRRYVTDEVTPGYEWVLAGEGVPTRKYDGTCIMFDGNLWWARREVKPGKTIPPGFIQVDCDSITGKRQGWEPVANSSHYKAFCEVVVSDDFESRVYPAGTYELVGPKVNGNPEGGTVHRLIPHGKYTLPILQAQLHAVQIKAIVRELPFEGVVWHHPDGRMAKLKARDLQ